MAKTWTAEQLLELGRSYQAAAILHAAADLDLFTAFAGKSFTAEEAAGTLSADLRGMRTLLDALVAIELLEKHSERYDVPVSVAATLSHNSPGNVLAMTQHQANCMRRWSQLGKVVKNGKPATREPSIRGEAADYASFIEAMDNIAAPLAAKIVSEIPARGFTRLLDVGGASGTWTIAFLRANPSAKATIFDLPKVIPQARERIAAAGLAERVQLVAGDFYTAPLPRGADLAWVSAIVHQNSRRQNRELFAKVAAALEPAGRILIRDIVMAESRTAPVQGALFAINMLVGTEHGGTFTLAELREDLEASGFADVKLVRDDPGMYAVVEATVNRR